MQINNNNNSSSSSSNTPDVTMFNTYDGGMKEFVFSFKNRPFGVAVSPSLPVPTTSLIDFNLVQQLGITMNNIQYRKFSYNNFKLRIAGNISVTAQCVKSGTLSGNVHLKALVVIDLHNCLDVDSIAGAKMAVRLTGAARSPDVQETVNDTIKMEGCKDVPKLSQQLPDDAKLPQQLPASPISAGTSRTDPNDIRSQLSDSVRQEVAGHDAQREGVGGHDDVQPEGVGGRDEVHPEEVRGHEVHPEGVGGHEVHPKGVGGRDDARGPPDTHADLVAKSEARRVRAWSRDNTDLYPDLHHHVRAIADTASLSPHAANLSMLDAMFGKADVRAEVEEQIQVLLDVDGDGDLDEDPDGVKFTFIKYDGSLYKPGHGRYKCNSDCSMRRKPPHNWGYHPDYLFPINFSRCSSKCKGAFCKCIRGGSFDI